MSMKISVTVKTGAKQNDVKKIGEVYEIKVKARPIEGAANEAVVKALSEYFKIPKSLIKIKSGHAAKRKVLKLGD